jgi:hypothetical protein
MVLEQVAQGAGLVIEQAAFDADGFRRGNDDALNVTAIPDGLEEWVVEAEGQDVL